MFGYGLVTTYFTNILQDCFTGPGTIIRTIAPASVKQIWRMWVSNSRESTNNYNMTQRKKYNKTCACFRGCNLFHNCIQRVQRWLDSEIIIGLNNGLAPNKQMTTWKWRWYVSELLWSHNLPCSVYLYIYVCLGPGSGLVSLTSQLDYGNIATIHNAVKWNSLWIEVFVCLFC